ncbi:MAG: hypothetical protein R2813_04875 [Flavobacteriales bacterium]
MKYLFPTLLFFFGICASQSTIAQRVKIIGKVIHKEDPTFNLLIVNKTTGIGGFGNPDGTFELWAQKSDTILVGALGYETEKLCMVDSAIKDRYYVKVFVRPLAYRLKEVQVFPLRELDSIQKDIRALGYDERDYMLSGIDAFHSPLTFLYQQVSRKERMMREAYEMINEEHRRTLLKELFAQYVSYDIIDLRPDQFEDFVDFIGVSEAQMKSMSQYDFIIFTKNRYKAFVNTPPKLRQDIDTHD